MDKQEFFGILSKAIGSKVDLINKAGINKGIYPSSLLDIRDNLIGIAQPMHKGNWVQMSGMELTINVKSGGNLIEALVVSRETTFEGFTPVLWVEPTGKINKIQRRSFIRVPCLLDAECYFLEIYSETETDAEPELYDPKEWFPIVVNNISLGGIAATVKQGFEADFYKRGRYLLAIDLGGGLMFLNLLLRSILNNDESGIPTGAFAFGGLSVYQDRVIGNFVRRQELLVKQR